MEIITRLIHKKSRRSRKTFVAVNCAALPVELLESEIFGHRRWRPALIVTVASRVVDRAWNGIRGWNERRLLGRSGPWREVEVDHWRLRFKVETLMR